MQTHLQSRRLSAWLVRRKEEGVACVVDQKTYGMCQPDGQTPQRPSGIPASTMFGQPRGQAGLLVSHTPG
jgi:hypothetical protein